jgi:PhnB protein
MNNTPQISPYLNFNGNCEEAMKFYQSVLGGDLEINRVSDFAAPDAPKSDTPEGVMHSTLTSGGLTFMASDGGPNGAVVFGNSVSLSLAGNDLDQFTQFFNGLSADGTVTLPLAKQMWGDTFGMFTDKFGIHWLVNIAAASTA